MTNYQKFVLGISRLSLGWLFFYAGITKVLDPSWTAAGYLRSAKTFPELYTWLASPEIIGYTNFLNKWGLTLIGVALLLGVAVRLASSFGVLMMLMYYFPILAFPKIGTTSYLVDQHILFALLLLTVGAFRAGRYFGFGNWCENSSFLNRYPRLKKLLS